MVDQRTIRSRCINGGKDMEITWDRPGLCIHAMNLEYLFSGTVVHCARKIMKIFAFVLKEEKIFYKVVWLRVMGYHSPRVDKFDIQFNEYRNT